MQPDETIAAARRMRRTTVRITASLGVLVALAGLAFAAATARYGGGDDSPTADFRGMAARPGSRVALVTPFDWADRPPGSPLRAVARATGKTTPFRGLAQVPTAQGECPAYPILETAPESRHSFYFTRGAYNSSSPYGGWRRGGRSSWRTDFEKADRQFLILIRELIDIDAFPCENPVLLDDPELRRFPFLYMVEVGNLGLTEPEIEGLRSYLLAGGFLLVDDFWGRAEWANFERNIRRVLPEYPIVEVPADHPVLNVAYQIDEVLQVPSINNARWARGPEDYSEQGGTIPYVRGIFDDDGRLMVGIVFNSDLGDAWEWAEQPDYPWDRANFAIKMGVNFIVYAMTH